MATLNIQGQKVKVDDAFLSMSPEQQNATVEEIAGKLGVAPESDVSRNTRQDLSRITQSFGQDKGDSAFRNVDSFMRGAADVASFGLADEIAALGNATVDAVTGNPGQYDRRLRQERITQEIRDQADPIASTVGRIAGGVGTASGLMKSGVSLTGKLAADAGLGAKVGAGALEGAGYGGAYGFGSGEGIQDRLADAAGGAIVGAAIGGAVPVLAAGTKAVTKPITDAISARINPSGYAGQKVAERLAASNTTPEILAARMEANPGLSMADLGGKSTRDLLRTAVNIPGPAKDSVAKQVTLRQFGQGDRLKSVIGRTFADPDGYLSAKDDIAAQAKAVAAPLYERAYAQPVHYSESLESILQTSAGKKALSKAEELASNEQVPFKQLFVQIADDGTGTARRVPDMRGWDYIKRAMDDMIDGQTDSLTRKVSNEGRILVNLKNRMLSEIDAVNPDYKAARQAFGGIAKLDDAMEFGRQSARLSPEAVRRGVANMSVAEREAARVGRAEELRKAIDAAGWTNNAILRVMNSRQQMQGLKELFETQQQFSEFRKQVFNEARKRATYDAVKGNSTTASQLADMFEAGGLNEPAKVVASAVTQGPVTATLQYVGSALRRLGGLTPEVADQVAKRLMTTSPDRAKVFMNELLKIDASKASKEVKARMVQALIARVTTEETTRAVSQSR